jgi:hypothetical protein
LYEGIIKNSDLFSRLPGLDSFHPETKYFGSTITCFQSRRAINSTAGICESVDLLRFSFEIKAYEGLTPSQFSSADKVHMGWITCIEKNYSDQISLDLLGPD